MKRLPIPKLKITEEMKERQLKLRKFLRGIPEVTYKEIRPIGFSIDTSTIPKNKIEEFLKIANSINSS
jgi:hypothetical protein